ncbi:CRISPR-associated protein Cas4 [Halovenus sp. HT40]|uniref:CRISPR-associated protein Cas4 n=1 Tax=Halovenus sp. HT40 TaxID=3126691 RepID=UPI00300F0CC2
MHAFRDIETATYCPRKLYYRKRDPDEKEIPEIVGERRQIAYEYESLLADDEAVRNAPLEVTPTQFRSRLGCARAKLDRWDELADPPEREAFLSGRECRGIVHKRLTDPPSLSLVFAGQPPENGIWRPQSARLVAGAKALSWEEETAVESVYAEYPAYGVIRQVGIDARRTAAYREAVRIADSIDGPPARIGNESKCTPCEYRGECGVKTRSLRSLLQG